MGNTDIGFAILPEYEGKGYSIEASIALMKYGITRLNLNPTLGITTHQNIKSRNLLNLINWNDST